MQGNNSDKELGEILINMNFASREQVIQGLMISPKEHTDIGFTLLKQEVITLEQLKIALKAQYGYEAVTEEQISNITRNTLSVLPNDFILMYKVIPLFSNKQNLYIGMVNPNDKMAVNNIIMYTGNKPAIFVLTLFEFREIIRKYFD